MAHAVAPASRSRNCGPPDKADGACEAALIAGAYPAHSHSLTLSFVGRVQRRGPLDPAPGLLPINWAARHEWRAGAALCRSGLCPPQPWRPPLLGQHQVICFCYSCSLLVGFDAAVRWTRRPTSCLPSWSGMGGALVQRSAAHASDRHRGGGQCPRLKPQGSIAASDGGGPLAHTAFRVGQG